MLLGSRPVGRPSSFGVLTGARTEASSRPRRGLEGLSFVCGIGVTFGGLRPSSGERAICMKAGSRGNRRGKKAGKGSNVNSKSSGKARPPKISEKSVQDMSSLRESQAISSGDSGKNVDAPSGREATSAQGGATLSELPISSTSGDTTSSSERTAFPDAPSLVDGVKRRRRRRKADDATDDAVERRGDRQAVGSSKKDSENELSAVDALSVDAVQRLTEDFRKGRSEGNALLSEIEKEPDFLLQSANPSGKYDLTSALLGIGKPNKQGVYLLPYLQSGHVLLLLVISLSAFVYYPGFPLTELDATLADSLKKGLALAFTVNLGLAFFSYREALKRDQPAVFWALKTSLLGGLALTELRNNTFVTTDDDRK